MFKISKLFSLAAVVLCCWAGNAAVVPAATAANAKIAVFPFELEDFSAAGKQEPNSSDATHLAQATEEAKQQLQQSGRYTLIDTAGADLGAAEGKGLRNCGGCEAPIAKNLGADQALIGIVTKISMMEYVVTLRVSDAQNGRIVSNFSTDLRMGASDSWFRGVRWLMKNRVLASE